MSKSQEDLQKLMANRRVFITGGSGFVGRNLIRYYRRSGAEVRVLTRSDIADRKVSEAGGIPVRGDMFAADLHLSMLDCDLLIHAAADTAHAYHSAEQWHVNVNGTDQVFAAAQRAGLKKAVYISTESVLLTGAPLIMADETSHIPEKSVGAYSRSKAAGEHRALAYQNEAMSVTIVRPRFVWGNGDTTALPQLTEAVNKGKFAWISNGNYLTSTTHIENLCQGISRAAEYGRNGEIYFITDDTPNDFREFVSALLATQGINAPSKSVPRTLIRILAQLGDGLNRLTAGRIKSPLNMQVFATSAVEVSLDITKARNELGYQPLISLERGLELMTR
ncbi:NAD-dependent epimerase/dehydratase family protein [Erwinia sp. S43]|uniref:NAD-dependent epimerase/dehydratase family protein n=1 Tax=Erwinia sp. S43 TaxID=2769339 RepID=UPI00190A7483|nr:NAD-dependent epimerase/dehydratase family protein [Erwinia sp. S43]MBK0033627.1 NAD-dependent epimerase/dehydratase family protein [Erwinia sp. S43]